MAVDFRLIGGNKIVSLGALSSLLDFLTSSQVVAQTSTWASTGTPVATRSNMGVTSGITGRNGAVLGPNGLIYAAPGGGGTDLLIIDPAAGTARLSTLGADFSGLDETRGWYGGVLAPDGRIFFLPYNAADVLVIDTTDTTSDPAGAAYRTTFGGVVTDSPIDSKWYGGVYANGKIYAVPASTADVLVIDPATDTAVRTDFGLDLSGLNKYHGAVVGTDGKVYCIPGSTSTILVIDPVAGTAVKTTLGATIPSGAKWRGGVLGPDGRIYGVPSSVNDWLVIDTDTQTATLSAFGDAGAVPSNGWWSGALGADGRIYGTPRGEGTILVLDTATGTATRETFGASLVSPTTNRWAGGGILAPDGALYCVPFSATDILRIDTNGSGADNLDVLLSPTLNKY